MKSKDTVAFSLRLPTKIVEQIDMRRTYTRRSRNAEITMILEAYLDRMVHDDEVVLQTIRQNGPAPR